MLKNFKKKILTGLLIIYSINLALKGQDTLFINTSTFLPDSRINSIPFINTVLDTLKSNGVSVIKFKKGRYDFWPDKAQEKCYYMSNTTFIPKRICAFIIEKRENLVIDGDGSDFIFHGKFQPFTIDSCKNITLKNFSIDWEIPFEAEARILHVEDQFFDLKIDSRKHPFVIEKNRLYFVGEGWKELWGGVKWNDPVEFDGNTLEVTAQTHDDLLGAGWETQYSASLLSEDMVRIFYNKTGLLKEGNYLILRIGIRDHAGVFIKDSKDISLEHINMHHNSGMSFLAQYSENLNYRNVNIIPGPGRKIISGHDDGFHFSNCRGKIVTENCRVTGLMDDSYNVHGSYTVVIEKPDDYTLRCKFPHFQSFGLQWARPEENIAFVNGKNMFQYGTGIVKSYTMVEPGIFDIVFKNAIPADLKVNDVLENLSWEPDVYIQGCYFGSHRARGVLISTRGKVEIVNNTFESSGPAIVFPADLNAYFENGPIQSALISNNLFKASCLTSRYMSSEGVINVSLEVHEFEKTAEPLHHNITITNNTFEVDDYPVLYALSVEGIKFNNNLLQFSNKNKPWHPRKFNLTFESCKNIQVIGNRIENKVLGKNIKLLHTKPSEIKLDKKQGFLLE